MSPKKTCAWLLGLLMAAAGTPGCSSGPSAPDATEAIGLDLQLAPGTWLASLSFSISNAALLPSPRVGVVDVSNSQTIHFVVGGLPVGDGYTITLSGFTTDANPLTCLGSADFSVLAGTTNAVPIDLVCRLPVDAGENGAVTVHGTTTLDTNCAAPTSLSASPSIANVGATMQLAAAGVDSSGSSSDVALLWTLSDATIGSLSSTSGGSTTFTCSGPGTETVTVGASVDGFPMCSQPQTQSVMLRCDATCTWGLANASSAATGAAPTSVTIGDWNGDGIPDLAVANSNMGLIASTVGVLLGRGDGTFKAQVTYPSGGLGASAVVSGDFNGDGRADLAVANTISNTVGVLAGRGDGTFGAAAPTPTGLLPSGLAVADLNGDHILDVVVADFDSNAVGPDVLLGRGDGTFQPHVPFTTDVGGSNSVAIGDFNDDGVEDVAAATDSTDSVSVVLGNGDGTFGPFAAYPTGWVPWSVSVADLNRDGKLDLVVANQGFGGAGSVSVLLGNGDGTFAAQVPYVVGLLPWFVAAGDLNGDGAPDVVVANNGSNNVGVLLGNGDGSLQAEVTSATRPFPASVAEADLNGDGRTDLVTANQVGAGNVSVLLGRCAP